MMEEGIEKFLHIGKITKTRMKEIVALKTEIENSHTKGLAIQMVPRHMRRRAASMRPKRLPHRLRSLFHKQKTASGSTKSISRRWKRSNKNMKQSWCKRNVNGIWLETHIWHAKRFLMKSAWGFKIPIFPNDKSYRALYRASKDYCMLHDLSFFCCIELKGNYNILRTKLNLLLSPSSKLTFGGKVYLEGTREGKLIVYKPNAFPCGVIGPVQFLWQSSNSDNKQIWLWIHPAGYELLKNTLIHLFEARFHENLPICSLKDNTSELVEIQVYKNEDVYISLLKNCLNRFRLSGPLSLNILKNILDPLRCIPVSSHKVHDSNVFSESKSVIQSSHWDAIIQMNESSLLIPHSVISLNVNIPDLKIPIVKKLCEVKLFENSGCTEKIITSHQTGVYESLLWDSQIRKAVADGNFTWTPVIIIQNPGSRNCKLGLGSGFDLIIPSGVSMKFWLPLIYNGARVGGARDLEQLYFEQEEPFYPLLYPDSAAGRDLETKLANEHQKKYNRTSCNKRVDYHSLYTSSPFKPDWIKCLRLQGSDNFFVLREREPLMMLQEILRFKNSETQNIQRLKSMEGYDYALVCVTVQALGKGSVKNLSMLCSTFGTKFNPQTMEISKSNYSENILGYIIIGNYSFSSARSSGVGFCSLKGLLEQLKHTERPDHYLYRNTNSVTYKWCKLKIWQ